jgi:prefoldin beta subunit
MELSKEISEKIEELRYIESNSQGLLMQKQNNQIELNEVTNALEEVKKTSGDVYKVSSNIMIKAQKNEIIKELEEKKKILMVKQDSIEKQEKIFDDKSEQLKKEINSEIAKKK